MDKETFTCPYCRYFVYRGVRVEARWSDHEDKFVSVNVHDTPVGGTVRCTSRHGLPKFDPIRGGLVT